MNDFETQKNKEIRDLLKIQEDAAVKLLSIFQEHYATFNMESECYEELRDLSGFIRRASILCDESIEIFRPRNDIEAGDWIESGGWLEERFNELLKELKLEERKAR